MVSGVAAVDDHLLGSPGRRHGRPPGVQRHNNGDDGARRQPEWRGDRRADAHPDPDSHSDADSHAYPHADSVGRRAGLIHALALGWLSSADTGGPWSILTGPTTAFSVTGGLGQVSVPASSERLIHLSAMSLKDVDAKAKFSFSGVSGTGGVYSYLLLRRQAAATTCASASKEEDYLCEKQPLSAPGASETVEPLIVPSP